MIKIEKRKKKPDILKVNGAVWTKELLDEVANYGSYKKLPDSVKKIVNIRYKHDDIRQILFNRKRTKCSFCETFPTETGFLEVEHFYPKSIYPEKAFDWLNLLPSCKRCNLKKSSLDTKKYPIVKPDEEDPTDYFTYDNIVMRALDSAPDKVKAERSIERLELNEFRLIKPRSELLVSLVGFENELKKTLIELTVSKQMAKKKRIVSKILDSLDQIDELMKKESKHSGFCKHFIESSKVFISSRKEINKYL
mgnify:CR=1 FL=1|tara:strand:+ start:699 stop:1451 length:753 start_codon:yes stop_codon:yes gene_type:complete